MPMSMPAAARSGSPERSLRFDWLMTLLSLWFCGGIFIDGWAHNHLASALETFFTPWHAIMYSGFGVCGLALLIAAGRNRMKGYPWLRSLPEGYVPSLIGAGIFAFGGGFDMWWHLTFGIEKDIEALLSPSHLILAVGAFLVFSGPLRAAWHRKGALGPSLIEWLPAALSLTFSLSVVTFMTQFGHPVRTGFMTGFHPALKNVTDDYYARAVGGILLYAALLAGAALLAVRRWDGKLPVGFFTAMLTINVAGMALMTDEYRLIFAAALTGLAADAMATRWRPSAADELALRTFAAGVPGLFTLLYFLVIRSGSMVWWSVHMWTGSIAMAALIGLLLSYVAFPPRAPEGA